MASEAVVDRMVVQLIGDGRQYRQMMNEAKAVTKSTTASMGTSLRNTQMGINGINTSSVAAAKGVRGFASTMAASLLPMLGLQAGIFALGGSINFVVKSYGDFDQAMTESTSIMKVTEEQTARMRDMALGMRDAIQTPEELAKSYFFLASAGKDAEQSIALLPVVTKFATAGMFDMALATDLLTDAQSALGMTSKDAATDMQNMTNLGDVLVRANTLANASVKQFSEALTNDAAASMRSFNIPLEEGVAVLAAMADQGNKGATAGAEFARAIRLMAKGARENKEAYREMNIAVFDSQGNFRNMADIFRDMENALGDMSVEAKGAALEQLGFNALAQRAILPIIGTSEAMREYEARLKEAGGTMEDVSEKQLKSFNNQMKLAMKPVKEVAIALGESLSPAIISTAKFIADAAQSVGDFVGNLKETATAMDEIAQHTLGTEKGFFRMPKPGDFAVQKTKSPEQEATDRILASFKELHEARKKQTEATKEATNAQKGLNNETKKSAQQIADESLAIQKQLELKEKQEAQRKKDQDDIKSTIESLREEVDTYGLSNRQLLERKLTMAQAGDETISMALAEHDLLEAMKKQTEAADAQKKKEEQRQSLIANTIQGLKDQAAMFGMSAEEMQVYKLKQEGASQSQIKFAQSLADQVKALKEDEDAKTEAKKATDEARDAEKRFRDSIRGVGIQGVGRGLDALARISDARNLRGEATKKTTVTSKSPFPLGAPGTNQQLEAKIVENQKKEEELLKQIATSTALAAEKDPVVLKPAGIGG